MTLLVERVDDTDESGTCSGPLAAAWCAARTTHPSVSVTFASFAAHVLDCVRHRLRSPDAVAHIRREIAHTSTCDVYLSRACLDGQNEAWARLDDLHLEALARLVTQWRLADDDPHNTVRELFADLAANATAGAGASLASYDGSGSLFAWLAVVLKRRLLRGRQRSRETSLDAASCELPDPSRQSPADELVERDVGARFAEGMAIAWQKLTERERLVVVAKFRDGLTQREIAHLCAIGEPRVSRIVDGAIAKMRSALRARLKDAGADQESVWHVLCQVAADTLRGATASAQQRVAS